MWNIKSKNVYAEVKEYIEHQGDKNMLLLINRLTNMYMSSSFGPHLCWEKRGSQTFPFANYYIVTPKSLKKLYIFPTREQRKFPRQIYEYIECQPQ